MNSHTPGPWMLATSNSWRRFLSRDGKSVCEPVTYSAKDRHPDLYFQNGGEDGPDARLIAAAPDLLAALQALMKAVEGVPCGPERQCHLAIARALGLPETWPAAPEAQPERSVE